MNPPDHAFRYRGSALLTDLYQLTMAYGYWKTGTHLREAVFHIFFRKAPFQSGYAIAAALVELRTNLIFQLQAAGSRERR